MKCACGGQLRVVMTRHHDGMVYRRRKCEHDDCGYGALVTEEKMARGNKWPVALRDRMVARLKQAKGRAAVEKLKQMMQTKGAT